MMQPKESTYPEYGIHVTLCEVNHRLGKYRLVQTDTEANEVIERVYGDDYKVMLDRYEKICVAFF